MELTVSEVADLVGGRLATGTDGVAHVTGAASLSEALPGDVSFFSKPKYLQQLRATKATAALVPAEFTESVPPACIRCVDPSAAFTKIVEKFAPPPVTFSPGVHPSAIIGKNVKLGVDVSIQPYAVIEEGAQIGDRSVIGAHGYVGHGAVIGGDCLFHARVTIATRCKIGSRVIIHSGVVIGADGFGYELQKGRYVKIRQSGIVQVDDDVEIGANSCVDRARFGRTWIGMGTKLDNLVQIGHNVVIGQHSVLCGQVGIAGSTVVGNYVTMAGKAGIAGHIEIGDREIVGAQAGVTKSLHGKSTWLGMPALPAPEFRRQIAHIHSIAKLKNRVRALEQLQEKPGEAPAEG